MGEFLRILSKVVVVVIGVCLSQINFGLASVIWENLGGLMFVFVCLKNFKPEKEMKCD